jgi:hypothetical protein
MNQKYKTKDWKRRPFVGAGHLIGRGFDLSNP